MEKLLSVLSVMQTHVIVTSEKNKQGNKHKKEQTIYSHTGLGLKSHRWFYSLVSKKSVMEWKIMLLNNILVHNLNSYVAFWQSSAMVSHIYLSAGWFSRQKIVVLQNISPFNSSYTLLFSPYSNKLCTTSLSVLSNDLFWQKKERKRTYNA